MDSASIPSSSGSSSAELVTADEPAQRDDWRRSLPTRKPGVTEELSTDIAMM